MTLPGSTWLRGPVASDGLAYHRIQEAGRPGVWRPLVGIVLMFLGFVLFGAVIATIVFQAVYLVTGQGAVDVARLADLTKPTPAGLAFLNVALATFIPLAMLTTRFVHGIAPRWLASVRPRIRWRYLFACLAVSVVALIATLVVGAVLPGQDGDVEHGHANAFTTTTFNYVLVILLAHAVPGGRRGVRLPWLPHPGLRRDVPLGLGGGPAAGLPVRTCPWSRPEPTGLLRPVRLRGRRRDPRDPHRRSRGRHRDARAQQLPGLRHRTHLQRHGLDPESLRWQAGGASP